MYVFKGKEMLKGSIVAIVTPFKNGNIDETSLRNLVNWHINAGTHGIVQLVLQVKVPH